MFRKCLCSLFPVLFQLWPAEGAGGCKQQTPGWGVWAEASSELYEQPGGERKPGSAAESSGNVVHLVSVHFISDAWLKLKTDGNDSFLTQDEKTVASLSAEIRDAMEALNKHKTDSNVRNRACVEIHLRILTSQTGECMWLFLVIFVVFFFFSFTGDEEGGVGAPSLSAAVEGGVSFPAWGAEKSWWSVSYTCTFHGGEDPVTERGTCRVSVVRYSTCSCSHYYSTDRFQPVPLQV